MTDASPGAAVEPRPRHAALEWWERLRRPTGGNPGALAQLRRSRSTPEALRLREAVELAVRTGAVRKGRDTPDWRVRASVDLARVLAHVKANDPGRHPMRAAGWKQLPGERRESDLPPGERPRLSETRFRRLLRTGDGEEKVSAFVRLVTLLDGTVDVESLSRDFLDWNHPTRGDHIRERWAFLYYGAGSAVPPSIDPTSDTEDDE